MRNAFNLTLSCACLVSCQALAGAILNTQTREFHVNPPAVGTTKIYADRNLLRLEINSLSSSEDGFLIFRGDRNEMIVADNERLEYFVVDEQTMNRMAEQVRETVKQMEEMLAEMPPEERASAEQEMQQQMPGLQQAPKEPGTLNKTGDSDTINGYDCEYYEVLNAGRKTRVMCVAKWSDIAGGAEAMDAMIGLGNFFERMHETFAQSSGVDVMGRQGEIFGHMRELGGYPVYARDFDDTGALEGESTLVSSEAKSIDPAMFAVPEGYRRGGMY